MSTDTPVQLDPKKPEAAPAVPAASPAAVKPTEAAYSDDFDDDEDFGSCACHPKR